MEHDYQSALEHLLIAQLRERGALEDIICEYAIDNLRACNGCGRLMREGWVYRGAETYCSDACLAEAHPEECIGRLRREAGEDDADTYWTAWEG